MSFVPFPVGTKASRAASALNVSVESAVWPADPASTGNPQRSDDCYVVVATNASTAGLAAAANVSIVVHPEAFFGAASNISRVDDAASGKASLVLTAGDLGTLTVTFSANPITTDRLADSRCMDGSGSSRFPCLEFAVTQTPLVIQLSFGRITGLAGATTSIIGGVGPGPANNITAAAAAAVQAGRVTAEEVVQRAVQRVGPALYDVYDAMMTAIAWNVNFEPRVAVTAPVSRTFESGFDFIFFDWDMFFLSLMAGTAPGTRLPLFPLMSHCVASGAVQCVSLRPDCASARM